MAYDTSFDYDRLLRLDQAKLVGRTRINGLGSYELTLNYNKITSATKEDCLEYLEAERLEITDPTFSNKTYEGVWKCVSIAYDENKSIIQQIFKIDSSVGDLGDWDGELPVPDWSAQSGDISRISTGMEVQKAYYWKITNPTDINLPPDPIAGEIWSKTANDNGDGTYDVVVSREIATDDLTSVSYFKTGLFTETTTTAINVDAVPEPTQTTGSTVRVTNSPLENGKYKTETTTRVAIKQVIVKTYKNDYLAPAQYPSITVFKNHTESELDSLLNAMNVIFINSVSMTINEYNLYDGLITGRFD